MKIGFIGTGVMGTSMVRHLLKAGHEVSIYTRTQRKAVELLNEGAQWKGSVKELASGPDVVMTMVGYPTDVEEIYLSENGLLNHVKRGAYVIDFTTSTPSLAEKIFEIGKEKEVYALDAPVSGGDVGAKNGTLAIMVGGMKETFETCLPLFNVIGTNVRYQGDAGAGQHTKMCNQIAIASNMIGVSEAVAYGRKAGLDLENVLKSISSGAAGSWSLSNLAPRMLQGNFEPGFYVKHFIKDMKIAILEAERMDLKLPGLHLAKELYEELLEEGYGEKGTQVLLKKYEV